MTTIKELESTVRLAKQDLDKALEAKQVAEKALSDVQSAISDADQLSTLTQKRHADAQSALNRVMADPKSTVDAIMELRKTLKESVVQQGDASDSINAGKQDLKQAARAAVEAGDNVVAVERAYWRTVWQREAYSATQAAGEHLKRAWGAALLSKEHQPGQFDSLLKRHFKEPDETECRALAETMR